MSKSKNLLVNTEFKTLPQFNLTLIHSFAGSHRLDETGKPLKNQPILKPLDWVHLEETQNFLYKVFNKSGLQLVVNIDEDIMNNLYTAEFGVYLAYLRYCFGDDLTKIINRLFSY